MHAPRSPPGALPVAVQVCAVGQGLEPQGEHRSIGNKLITENLCNYKRVTCELGTRTPGGISQGRPCGAGEDGFPSCYILFPKQASTCLRLLGAMNSFLFYEFNQRVGPKRLWETLKIMQTANCWTHPTAAPVPPRSQRTALYSSTPPPLSLIADRFLLYGVAERLSIAQHTAKSCKSSLSTHGRSNIGQSLRETDTNSS